MYKESVILDPFFAVLITFFIQCFNSSLYINVSKVYMNNNNKIFRF